MPSKNEGERTAANKRSAQQFYYTTIFRFNQKNSKISTKPQTDAQMKAEKEKTQKAREKVGLPKRVLFVCESMGRRAVRSLLDRF